MHVLLAISVFLLLMALGAFGVWAFRESKVSASTIRTVFFGGTLAFLSLFLAFSWHTMLVIPTATNQQQLSLQVEHGKKAWQKYLCVECHAILGNGAYYAPDLTQAWPRFVARAGGDEDTARRLLIAFLENPPRATRSRRGMPDVVTGVDAAHLAAFLEWTSRIKTNGWPPPPRGPVTPTAAVNSSAPFHLAGEELYVSSGCPACHSIGGGAIVGPDLKDATRKYDEATLATWMRDPSDIYVRTGAPVNHGFPRMPALNVSEEDAARIAEYLALAGGGR